MGQLADELAERGLVLGRDAGRRAQRQQLQQLRQQRRVARLVRVRQPRMQQVPAVLTEKSAPPQ